MNPDELLEDALAGEMEPDIDSPPTAPLDLTQATSWVAHLARVRRQREEWDVAYQAAMQRLQERNRVEQARLDRWEAWLEEALEMFHRTVLANDPDALTIYTPAGTMRSKMGQPAVDIQDQEALIKFLLADDETRELVEFPPPPPPKVGKVPLRKFIKDNMVRSSDGVVTLKDGSTVPGVVWTDAERTFSVNTDERQPPEDVGEP